MPLPPVIVGQESRDHVGEVDRLMYASVSCVQGSVFETMQRIRAHALHRNVADGVHVALLHQSGWFMEWMEGPTAGVRAVMARVARDSRHRHLKLLHSSRGPRRLSEPWSMAIVQTHEPPTAFAQRVLTMREEHRRGRRSDPATVWRRLSTPRNHPGATEHAHADRFQRVMVCAADGTASFDLVRWLGDRHRAEVVHRRFAGSRDDVLDVATDYVDLDSGSVVRRVIAMARNGLQIGLTQAFLPDYSHVVVVLCDDNERNVSVMSRLVAACQRMNHRPVIVALEPLDCDHSPLQRMADEAGLVYLGTELAGAMDTEALWSATEPLLDLSVAANSEWPAFQAVA